MCAVWVVTAKHFSKEVAPVYIPNNSTWKCYLADILPAFSIIHLFYSNHFYGVLSYLIVDWIWIFWWMMKLSTFSNGHYITLFVLKCLFKTLALFSNRLPAFSLLAVVAFSDLFNLDILKCEVELSLFTKKGYIWKPMSFSGSVFFL